MTDARVLVAGATGQLGGRIARQLMAAGMPIRALARDRARLQPLADAGAEVAAVDLQNMAQVNEACRGISQIVSTVNNNMGAGAKGPGRIDLTAHQNLCAAARNAHVDRLIYVSFRGVEAGDPVDIFRIKWYIEDAIRRSGVPHVLVRPTSFMDVWIDEVLGERIRAGDGALIFGDGTSVGNYIAVDDVATFVARIVQRPEIVNEAIPIGGPSDISLNDLATLMERKAGVSGRRRHIPVAVLRWLPVLLRPFNEVAARRVSLGYYAATRLRPFPEWRAAADRFGVEPMTIERYVTDHARLGRR
jgi:uncharacterized protein YbjT (DUF2867 family)